MQEGLWLLQHLVIWLLKMLTDIDLQYMASGNQVLIISDRQLPKATLTPTHFALLTKTMFSREMCTIICTKRTCEMETHINR